LYLGVAYPRLKRQKPPPKLLERQRQQGKRQRKSPGELRPSTRPPSEYPKEALRFKEGLTVFLKAPRRA